MNSYGSNDDIFNRGNGVRGMPSIYTMDDPSSSSSDEEGDKARAPNDKPTKSALKRGLQSSASRPSHAARGLTASPKKRKRSQTSRSVLDDDSDSDVVEVAPSAESDAHHYEEDAVVAVTCARLAAARKRLEENEHEELDGQADDDRASVRASERDVISLEQDTETQAQPITVHVRIPHMNVSHRVFIRPNDSLVGKMRGPLCARHGLQHQYTRFEFRGQVLGQDDTANSASIRNGSTICLLYDESSIGARNALPDEVNAVHRDDGVSSDGKVLLRIRVAETGDIEKVRLRTCDPIDRKVRPALCKRLRLDPNKFYLELDGDRLELDETAAQHDLENGMLIELKSVRGH